MTYRVVLPKKVQKDLQNIDNRFLHRIESALKFLAQEPLAGKKLSGNRTGQYSYKVWPYRIIYEIYRHELLILVIRIAHRQGAYK